MRSAAVVRGFTHGGCQQFAAAREAKNKTPAGGAGFQAGTGWEQLTRTTSGHSYGVSIQTAEGRTHSFAVSLHSDGSHEVTATAADATARLKAAGADGVTTRTLSDGTTISDAVKPDPTYGIQAPVGTTVITLPSGAQQTTSTSRSHSGGLSETVTTNGKIASRSYSTTQNGGTWNFTSPLFRQAYRDVDHNDRLVSSRVTGIAPTQFAYDTNGRLSSTSATSGSIVRSSTFTYFASGPNQGRLDSMTDPENRVFSFEYDLAGRITKKHLPGNREISFAYDANGNLTSLTPPGRAAHVFDYTTVDQQRDYTPPALDAADPATHYVYNLDKDLVRITRPGGEVVTFDYNAAGKKLSTITIPTGSYSFSYVTTSGKLDTLTSPSGQTLSYSYDGMLTTGEGESGAVAGTVSWSHDNDFRMSGISVNGSAIALGYDNDSLLTSAGALTLSRDSGNGLLTGTTLGSVTSTVAYNGFGELASDTAKYQSTTLFQESVTQRDKLGRITQTSETIQGQAASYVYGYDVAGRLATVTRDGSMISTYGYDANGNRVSLNATAATYDGQDRLLTYGSASYGYSAAGDLQSKTESGVTTQYVYDVMGNLTHVTLPGDIAVDYVIDGRNRRVGKKVNGVLTQGFLYQDQLKPVAELDGSGSVVSRFVYGSKANIPDYMVKAGTTYRIVSDHLGSPRLVVKTSDGTIAQRMDYDEFGNVTSDTNPGFQPFGFAGGIYDLHTGFVRFGARDYDARTGRWTAKDPIGFVGGLNQYAYVDNDSINLIDVSGLMNLVLGGSGAIVVGAAGAEFGSSVGFNFEQGVLTGYTTTGSGAGVDGGQYGLYGSLGGSIALIQGGPNNVAGPFVNHSLSIPGTTYSITVYTNPQGDIQGFGVGYGPGFGAGTTTTETTPYPARLLCP